jgi:hypothetical protein
LTHGLDYQRGLVIGGVTEPMTDHWNPWNTSLATWDQRRAANGVYINPQPELSSMAFTRDGSLILGFRDRFMDVIGAGGLDPRPLVNTAEQGMSGGAIDMACSTPKGGYDWEGTGDCPNNATPANDGNKPAGVVQYFPGDFFDPNHTGTGLHQDASQGSVAYVPQQQWVVSTELDPALHVSSDGLGYYDVKTGIGPGQDDPAHGYQFVGPENSFGKAGGLGDIAYTAANAPIQIGNYVWFDGDHNGIQDAHSTNEVPLAGSTVNLLNADGKQVATTTTDAAGERSRGGVPAHPRREVHGAVQRVHGEDRQRPRPATGERTALHPPAGRQRPGARLQRRPALHRPTVQRLRAGHRTGQTRRRGPHDRRGRLHPGAGPAADLDPTHHDDTPDNPADHPGSADDELASTGGDRRVLFAA